MKGGAVFVWLSGEQRKLLIEYAKKLGWSKSRVLRVAFVRFVEADNSELEEQAVVEEKLRLLEDEDRRLLRAQRLILKNCAYLQKYVRQLMEGGWDQQHAKLGRRRPPLPETPGASLTINALEGIFARRREIGVSVARLASKCWKGKYEAPLDLKVKRNSQTVFGFMFPFPLCPYWATSRVNKRFEGLPNRKHCDMQDKEVLVEACWTCWNKGMKEKVESDSLWDSWRKSREYQELRVFLDQFDFDENMEWLRARNGRSVATLNKQAGRRDKKHGSDT